MIKLKDLLTEDISMSQLNQVEKHLDKIWAKVGIDVEFTRHFHDRVNDARNKKPINTAELLRIYKQIYKRYGKPISKTGQWSGIGRRSRLFWPRNGRHQSLAHGAT